MNANPADRSTESSWPTLLCIDDDPEIAEGIRIRLQEYEIHVVCGYHGTHGIWLAKRESPDVVITDMRMPQGRGDYIVECLRSNSQTRDIPTIVMTGESVPKVEQGVDELNVQAFLRKPVPFHRLLATIERYVTLRKREDGGRPDSQQANPWCDMST